MTDEQIRVEIAELLTDVGGRPVSTVDPHAWLDVHGLDSLQYMVYRERVERAFAIHISDRDWLRIRSFDALMRFVADALTDDPDLGSSPVVASAIASVANSSGPRLVGTNLFEDIEIGMPLTGRNNLAEGPLLQRLGDLRWRHISAQMGVPTREIKDEEEDRLYPTFFYVEMTFPDARPMGAWGENDRLRACSTLRRFGASMLDGLSFLLPPDHAETREAPYADTMSAVEHGVPVVRLSNIFVKQFAGPGWLKKSRPQHEGFLRIPETAVAPDSYETVKIAERAGRFVEPQPGWIPLTDGPVRTEYRLVPDRDLNGAGLVYFANYPVFLDICERQVLENARVPVPTELVDRRTLRHRRSAYLNNASSRDTLDIDVESWVVAPPGGTAEDGARLPLRFVTNFRMSRRSDGRLMMVSSAEKVVPHATIGDLNR